MTDDKTLRRQIASQIRIAAPLAIVWPRWVLGAEVRDWPAVMRSSLDSNRVHGWCVSRRTVPVTEEMSDHVSLSPRYTISGVHYHLVGTDDDNTEDLFQAEIDAIIAQFAMHDETAIEIANHDGMQFRIIGYQNSGAELLHWALADLTLYIC